jgi:hypothetical protein
MRYIGAALAIVIASAAAAAAQETLPTVRIINSVNQLMPPQALQARLSADDVLARVMSFDRDRDGKVVTGELSERMQNLVGRGDRSGDGALDESEIRLLATSQQFAVRALSGGYGFGDISGLSSRNHIENSIDDLRLAPDASREAKRIAAAFVEEFEGAAAANLRYALAPVLPEQQLAQLEASLNRSKGIALQMPVIVRITSSSASGAASQPVSVTTAAAVTTTAARQKLTADQLKAVAVAADTFRAEQQFDDARRFELVARLGDVLTEEEGENLRAALTRRPLVKGPGSSLTQMQMLETLRAAQQQIAPPAVR